MVYAPGPLALIELEIWLLRRGVRHLPGKHDQLSHGGKGGFDAHAASAETGQAAHSSAALKSEPSESQGAAIRRMGGDGSYVVNGDLRSQSGHASALTDKNRGTVEQMDSVMKTASLSGDVIVHRHIGDPQGVFGFDQMPHDLTGLSWRDHGFVSTSVVDRGSGHRVRLRILVPAGTHAFSHPDLDSDEILLDRGLTFTVVRDHTPGEVVRHLDVEVS